MHIRAYVNTSTHVHTQVHAHVHTRTHRESTGSLTASPSLDDEVEVGASVLSLMHLYSSPLVLEKAFNSINSNGF